MELILYKVNQFSRSMLFSQSQLYKLNKRDSQIKNVARAYRRQVGIRHTYHYHNACHVSSEWTRRAKTT